MSNDFTFWKPLPGHVMDPVEVYTRLSDGEFVEGLERLPGERILARIAEEYSSGWRRFGECGSGWERVGGRYGEFGVSFTAQSLTVTCRGLSGDDFKFSTIAAEFGCVLYDTLVEEWKKANRQRNPGADEQVAPK